jgi:hypothetical protein
MRSTMKQVGTMPVEGAAASLGVYERRVIDMLDGPALKRQARVAGLLYFVSSIFAVFALMYVPQRLIVSGNATATGNAIRGAESLFRAGIGSELVGMTIFIFVVLALYRLFEAVDRKQASLMVILILLSVPLSFVSVLSEMGALTLFGNADFLSVLGRHQLDALALLFLKLHSYGWVLASVFSGLWLFPFGTLVIRSRFIPRIFGYLLIVAGFGWLIDSFTTILMAHPGELVSTVTTVLESAELPIIFWLLIWGARVPRVARPSSV